MRDLWKLLWRYRAALAVIACAAAYRREEQNDTPRLWRGQTLHDLASKLDDALQHYEQS